MSNTASTHRIATVTATGKRYFVQSIHFGKNAADVDTVHCWGDVVKFMFQARVLRTLTHDGSKKSFPKSEVTITEVLRTQELMTSLLEQTKATLREAGHIITGGRHATDHGTREQIEARRAALKLGGNVVKEILAIVGPRPF